MNNQIKVTSIGKEVNGYSAVRLNTELFKQVVGRVPKLARVSKEYINNGVMSKFNINGVELYAFYSFKPIGTSGSNTFYMKTEDANKCFVQEAPVASTTPFDVMSFATA